MAEITQINISTTIEVYCTSCILYEVDGLHIMLHLQMSSGVHFGQYTLNWKPAYTGPPKGWANWVFAQGPVSWGARLLGAPSRGGPVSWGARLLGCPSPGGSRLLGASSPGGSRLMGVQSPGGPRLMGGPVSWGPRTIGISISWGFNLIIL